MLMEVLKVFFVVVILKILFFFIYISYLFIYLFYCLLFFWTIFFFITIWNLFDVIVHFFFFYRHRSIMMWKKKFHSLKKKCFLVDWNLFRFFSLALSHLSDTGTLSQRKISFLLSYQEINNLIIIFFSPSNPT